MLAGGTLAVGGSGTGVAIPVGGAIAAGGAVEAGHGMTVMAKAVNNIGKVGSTSGSDYSNIPDPKNVSEGKKTTSSQRGKILEENKKRNNGQLRSDGDGRVLNKPSKNTKGQKADMNQAEVDYIKARSKGGTNSNSNLRVISKEENLKKGNR